MSEAMKQAEHESNEGKEVINTDDANEAIVAAVEGKEVCFAYSTHYRSYVTFKPDGTVVVEDGDVPKYEHELYGGDSTMDKYITSMRRAIEVLKAAKMAVPGGNIDDFGGMMGIAQSVMTANLIGGYVDAFNALTSKQQDVYRKQMTDRRGSEN